MTELLAHSARPAQGVPAQPYAVHVRNAVDLAVENARRAAPHSRRFGERLVASVRLAAEFHDLGKLDEANQQVLRSSPREKLRLNHADAGAACLTGAKHRDVLAAALVRSHHIGLPSFPDECCNPKQIMRDRESRLEGTPLWQYTDAKLEDYIARHRASARPETGDGSRARAGPAEKAPFLFRIALSCLVDADHEDSARHEGKLHVGPGVALRPTERLGLLDRFIAGLSPAASPQRSDLRATVYDACRASDTSHTMYACGSPVGTGKTTAVMAHLLQAAHAKGLRRIFVVLPFTNIIDQSVEVYRKALTRPGERCEETVAAHHHRAEYDDILSRQLAFLWRAPVVVTTAVQFFETLAASRPASLRKLHELPGSAVFIDETHAALPTWLWPQAWRWLNELAEDWGCHLVLGSGSLARFWELEEFSERRDSVPELVPASLATETESYEKQRVRYRTQDEALDLHELLDWAPTLPGPRLLIVNTVQSAAVVAQEMSRRMGRQAVEHLSTSLSPRDRRATLDKVRERLLEPDDSNWTLVATSCVEAGLDLSFRTGLRESASLMSLLQASGRVNREGTRTDAEVWDFRLRHDEKLTGHPLLDESARVLHELFREQRVGVESVTEAMRREIRRSGLKVVAEEIVKKERSLDFPAVADKFKVIDSNTVTAVVEKSVQEALDHGRRPEPQDLQLGSVQIWRHRAMLGLREFDRFPGLFCWTLAYDEFLGYMAGLLQVMEHCESGSIV